MPAVAGGDPADDAFEVAVEAYLVAAAGNEFGGKDVAAESVDPGLALDAPGAGVAVHYLVWDAC